MAVNALVIRNGIPVPVSREQFLHMDEGLSIEIGNHSNYKGKGKVYLTNYRILFLKRDPSRKFSSFSVPYLFIIKHKYNKKLLGGPVISGTTKTITNGGLHQDQTCKFAIAFNDANTGKTFYNLLQRELIKLQENKYNENPDRYKRVTNTPSLSVEQIFPEQFAAYKRSKAHKAPNQNNIVLNNNKKQQIVVGQSAADAPMQLTHDFRAQKAKLFSSTPSKTNVAGPISGASPVNVGAFTQHRHGRTAIEDETNKYQQHQQQQPQHHPQHDNHMAAPAAQYNAYVDPSHPDDIVLSVPINDDEFDNDEGKSNQNANGYMYGIGQQYDEKHKSVQVEQAALPSTTVTTAVSVGIDDGDDFAERPKGKPAAVGTKHMMKSRPSVNNVDHNNNQLNAVEFDDLFAQKSDGSQGFAMDDPWTQQFSSNDQLLPSNTGNKQWEE